jgi:hypothetical protein
LWSNILDQQNSVTYLIDLNGRPCVFSAILFFLLFTILFSTPSNLLAITQDKSIQINSLISSINNDKTEYFQSQLDKYIGIPYRRGGSTEKGFDCSGFVRQVYSEFFGLDLPHQSGSQSSLPFMQKITKDDLITGDLVFFTTGKKNKRINHVGIYLSDGRFIHAAKGGVTVSSLDSSYWKARFFVAKRVGNDDDIWNRFETDQKLDSSLLIDDINYSSRFNILNELTGNLSAFEGYPYYKDDSNDSLSMGYEISWSTSLANGSIVPKVSAFQDYYRPGQSILDSSYLPFSNNGNNLANVSSRSSDQGMNFAAAFERNDISLTPSIAYFDTGYDLENQRLQRFTYGLDLEISPVNQPWLISFGMKFSDYTYSYNMTSNAGFNEFRSPMNMSLTYLHQLSKSAYLSFTGQVVQRYEPSSINGSLDQWKDDRRSLLLFNYKY